ncbi:MAG: hypothetical protein OXE56_06245 [Gammaproteobacteria bacterium]|nr:hypothetical protein [Gammaproteobacteria bacterium]
MRKSILFLILIFLPFLSVAQTIGAPLFPGTFEISLGDYSDWNARVAESNCEVLGLECELDDDEYRVVGDKMSSASSKQELRDLTWEFGFECLDKAAVFIDRGQHIYPNVGEFGGQLFTFFLAEANRCWDYYDDFYERNKAKF